MHPVLRLLGSLLLLTPSLVFGQLSITTTVITPMMVNRSASGTLTAIGGTGTLTWSILSGAFPSGVALTSTGSFSGVPVAGTSTTYSVTVRVVDSALPTPREAIRSYQGVVYPELTISPSVNLQDGLLGAPYSQQLTASGGAGTSYLWYASGLPTGLSLDPNTGMLSGTPQVSGVFTTITIVVVDASSGGTFVSSRIYRLTVTRPPLIISTSSALQVMLGSGPISITLAATGGSGVGFTWALAPGSSLPGGVSLSNAGVLTGTPIATGTFRFTVQVADSTNTVATASLQLTVSAPVAIATASPLPTAVVNRGYSLSLTSTGGTTSGYVYTVTAGSLPPGVTLSAGGTLAGAPTASGTYTFTVTVVDSANNAATKPFQWVVATSLVITTSTLPAAAVGMSYTAPSLVVTGGTGSGYSWALSPGSSLPPGLSLTAAGTITGTPTAEGTFTFSVNVEEAGGLTATQVLSLLVVAQLRIRTAAVPSWTVGAPYSQTLAASGGIGTYIWSVAAGTLPPGMTLSAGGVLSGTPTATGEARFTTQVVDGAQNTVTAAFTLLVNTQPQITTSTLPVATLGRAYRVGLLATGGTAPLRWTIGQGALPQGLTVTDTGVISGTPGTDGIYPLVIHLSDAAGVTVRHTVTLSIRAGNIQIPPLVLPGGTVGVPYTAVTLTATGGTGPYTWLLLSGQLSPGLTLSSTGTISGVPTVAGEFSITTQVRDQTNSTATRGFVVNIASPTLTIVAAPVLPDATHGISYSTRLSASGGTGSGLTWSTVGTGVPLGLALSPTGQISGVPTVVGSFTFLVQVADALGNRTTQQCALQVLPFSFSPTVLPHARVGAPFSVELTTVGGGTAPLVWSTTEQLPPGITLTAGGVLTGTPTQAGSFVFSVRVRDAAQLSGQHLFTLNIETGAISIASDTPPGTVGRPYSYALQASGGTAPYEWHVVAGALPGGIAISSDGTIAGTPQTTAGSPSVFIVRATDSESRASSQTLTMPVAMPPSPLTIGTTALPAAAIDTPYSQLVTVVGGTGPYNWSVAGILPPGLTLSNTGLLSGRPTQAGTFIISITVTDATRQAANRAFTITVSQILQITTASGLPNAIVGAPYSQPLAAAGGRSEVGYAWTMGSGALPPGLLLTPGGVITGTATIPGLVHFTVRVHDSLTTVEKAFSLNVRPSPLEIETTTLPHVLTGHSYTHSLAARGGTAPYLWNIVAGSLPSGMELSRAGVIAGQTTSLGVFAVLVSVRDGSNQTASMQLSLQVLAGLAITTVSLRPGTVGVPYVATTLLASGGTAPYTWTLASGAWPPGLTVSPAGLISGTPTIAGLFPFEIRVSDMAGNTRTATLQLHIATPLVVVPEPLALGTITQSYNHQLLATGGTPPLQWAVVGGALPAGITLSTAGVLSGTPVIAGVYRVSVQVADSIEQRTTQDLILTIRPGLDISAGVLHGATAGVPYSFTFTASGPSTALQWNTDGPLPPGLVLSPTGVLSGVPTVPGSYAFTISLRDGTSSLIVQRQFMLTIVEGLRINTEAGLPPGMEGSPYSQSITVIGGTGPYRWTVVNGSLPAGLQLNSTTGFIAGVLPVAGTYTFMIRVSDSQQQTVERPFTLTVVRPLRVVPPTFTATPVVGTLFEGTLTAVGGHPPYVWTIAEGGLPTGLRLDTTTGIISGTPTVSDTFAFTVRVTDTSSTAASANVALAVTRPQAPSFSIEGLPRTIEPRSQLRISIVATGAYHQPLSGTLTVEFLSDTNGDDPAIVFSTGQRSINVVIPAHVTQVPLPVGLALQTGTVAGRIRLTFSVRSEPPVVIPVRVVEGMIARSAPVVVTVAARRTEQSIEVEVAGFATPRELLAAKFVFAAAPGGTIDTAEVNVSLVETSQRWFQSTAAIPFGSSFRLLQRFVVTGNVSVIRGVEVRLTNVQGTSAAASATF